MIKSIAELMLAELLLTGWLLGYNSHPVVVSPAKPLVNLPSKSLVSQVKSPQIKSTLSFNSLSQGESYTANLQTPRLFIISKAAEAARLTQLLNDSSLTQQIQSVNLKNSYIVAVVRGQAPSSGYGIAIKRISPSSGKVQIAVNLTDPPRDRNVATVITYPYHVVVVPRNQLSLATARTWSVATTDGKVLLQQKYP